MSKETDLEAAELIPISESVKLLDEKYPHLRDISWNSKEDEEEDKE